MKNFKLILILNVLGFLPSLCLAESSLQNDVINKVFAEHSIELKSGSFSRRQSADRSSGSRIAAAVKHSSGLVASSRAPLAPKDHMRERKQQR